MANLYIIFNRLCAVLYWPLRVAFFGIAQAFLALRSTCLSVSNCAYRYRHSRRCVRRRQHVAPSIKYSARVNHHARRMYFARHHTLGLDFHSAFREDHSVKASRDHHAISFDLSFDLRILSQNHSLLRDDVALHVSVNAKRSRYRQRSFHRHTLIDKACPLFSAAVLPCRPANSTPCKFPQ